MPLKIRPRQAGWPGKVGCSPAYLRRIVALLFDASTGADLWNRQDLFWTFCSGSILRAIADHAAVAYQGREEGDGKVERIDERQTCVIAAHHRILPLDIGLGLNHLIA